MIDRIKVFPNSDAIIKSSTRLSQLFRLFFTVSEFSWIWIATVALFALSAIVAPGTVTSGSLLAMLPFAGILAITATGQTIVIQQRGLDLSSAAIIGLAGIVLALVSGETGFFVVGVGRARLQ